MKTHAHDLLYQLNTTHGARCNKMKLANWLRDGVVADDELMCHDHDGFNSPMDYDEALPLFMYFKDGSMLVVTVDRIFTAREDE